jgi:hypothetical protein
VSSGSPSCAACLAQTTQPPGKVASRWGRRSHHGVRTTVLGGCVGVLRPGIRQHAAARSAGCPCRTVLGCAVAGVGFFDELWTNAVAIRASPYRTEPQFARLSLRPARCLFFPSTGRERGAPRRLFPRPAAAFPCLLSSNLSFFGPVCAPHSCPNAQAVHAGSSPVDGRFIPEPVEQRGVVPFACPGLGP